MLILRRKAGEAISIGEDVRVVIVDIQGNQVKVGVDAPSGVAIYRDEVLAKIKAENIKSANMAPEFFQTDFIQDILKNVPKRNDENDKRGLKEEDGED